MELFTKRNGSLFQVEIRFPVRSWFLGKIKGGKIAFLQTKMYQFLPLDDPDPDSGYSDADLSGKGYPAGSRPLTWSLPVSLTFYANTLPLYLSNSPLMKV